MAEETDGKMSDAELDTLIEEAQVEAQGIEETPDPSPELATEEAPETSEKAKEDTDDPRISKLEEDLGRIQKRYDDLRPEFDRKGAENSELKNTVSQLQQQLQLLQSQQQRGVDEATARREQEALAKKWRSKLAEEPEAAWDLLQQFGREIDSDVDARLRAIEERYEAKLAELQTGIKQADPEVKQLSTRMKTLMEDYDMSFDSALKFARDEAKAKGPAQPGRTPAPAPSKTERAPTGDKPKPPPRKLDSMTSQIAKDAGLSAELVAELEKELAEEMV